MQLFTAAQFVQPKTGIDQPLERLTQIRFAGQMGSTPLRRKPTLAGILDPRMDDLAMSLDLVQVVAAQSFVAQADNTLPHQLISHLQRLARSLRLLAGLQSLAVSPPC